MSFKSSRPWPLDLRNSERGLISTESANPGVANDILVGELLPLILSSKVANHIEFASRSRFKDLQRKDKARLIPEPLGKGCVPKPFFVSGRSNTSRKLGQSRIVTVCRTNQVGQKSVFVFPCREQQNHIELLARSILLESRCPLRRSPG